LINYFKSYSSLGDDRFLCHPVLHSCKSERHFRSKDQAPSHGAGIRGKGPPSFLCPSQILLCPEKFVLNYKNKNIIKKNIVS